MARHGLDGAEDIVAEEGGKEAVVRITCFYVPHFMSSDRFTSIIFELIKGEMAYVKDLENIEIVRPLTLCYRKS